MTPEEWKRAESAVHSLVSYADLDVDGYKVSIRMARATPYKNVVQLFVNGEFKGKWLTTECEERRRFIRQTEVSILSKKDLEDLRKELRLGKREFEAFMKKHNNKCPMYHSTWPSFKALKSHLCKNNENISLLSPTT